MRKRELRKCLVERGLGIAHLRRHRPPVRDRGKRPGPSGALGEPDELLRPALHQTRLDGAHGGVDAIRGGHTRHEGESEPAEVVQGSGSVSGGGRAHAPGPAPQVVHRIGRDAQRVRCHDIVQVAQQAIDVFSALDGRQHGQPGDRQSGQGRLPGADGKGSGLLGAAAHQDEVAAHEMPEAQPLQHVDDRGDGPRLPGSRQRVGVEAVLTVIVTELESGVAEVPQEVAIVHVLPGEQSLIERCDGFGPLPFGRRGHGGQQLLETAGTRRVLGGRSGHDVPRREPRAAVGSEGAHHCGRGRDFKGANRIDLVDVVGGVDEDPVRLGGGPDVDLDVSPEPSDVTDQQRVGRPLPRRREQSSCAGTLSAGPGAASCGEGQFCTSNRVAGQRRRSLVRGRGRDVATASQRPRADELEGRDHVLVGTLDRAGPMPRLPIRVPGTGEGIGQGPVHESPVRGRGRLVDRRPQQRVTHPHGPAVDTQEPGLESRFQRRLPDPQPGRGPPNDGSVPGVVRRSQQQQQLHPTRQPTAPVEERALDLGSEAAVGLAG